MMHKNKIRPPRRVSRVAAGDSFEQSWGTIRDALGDIHNQNAGKLSFEQLYRASYKIVRDKRGEDLYQRVKEFEESYFHDKVIPQIWELVTHNLAAIALHNVPGVTANERRVLGERFLHGIKDSWKRHNTSMNMVADVLMYLDRGYSQSSKKPLIYTTTIGLFRDHILRAPLPASTWADIDTASSNTSNGLAEGGHPTIFTILNAVILDQINMDRDGDIVDRNLLRACIDMLESLYETDDEEPDEKLYLTSFEPHFLHVTDTFYRDECERLLRQGDASVWLRQARRRLVEEQERCGHTVSRLSRVKTARVVVTELIASRVEEFLAMEGTGLKSMIDNDRIEDLAILYELVGQLETKRGVLRQGLQNRIIELGLEIEKTLKETDFSVAAEANSGNGGAGAKSTVSASQQQTAAAIQWVSDILQLKEKFDRFQVQCFERDMGIQTAMTSSFTELFRMCQRSAEYVSLFIDDNFKRGLRGKTDAEVDATIDKATTMIQHVTERDMLERYYQKHLARRLLHNKSENPDAEKLMISRMQSELGKTFTTKFEGMFKDMTTSEELTRDYSKYAKENLDHDDNNDDDDGDHKHRSAPRIDLAVHVLTSNNWPPEVMGRNGSGLLDDHRSGSGSGSGSSNGGCVYPAEIQRLQASFLKFYLRNRSGRVLSWVGSAGTADIKCVFPAVPGHDKGPLSHERRYELNAPTYGMVVLMLFNDVADGVQLSIDEIQARTNLAMPDLTRALASLCLPPKSRVLVKEPPGKPIRPDDRFAFNVQFVSKTLRVKVPVVNALSKVEGEDERKATEQKNNQTRSHTVDAAIVRIMKQRKELTHTALVTEVVTQLASLFRPDVAMVKKRIEDLITREYIERIEEADPPAYRYVA